jgi:hypothetical protein
MFMNNLLIGIVAFHFLTDCLSAQNPPLTGNPYTSRGKARSPDGHYEWRVRKNPTIRYELIRISTGKAIAAVNAYYPDPDEMNFRYANAAGFYWNPDSSVVALDELNRRRAGYLYFLTLREGRAEIRRAEQLIPIRKTEEARLVVDPGWISPTKIRVGLAAKSGGADSTSKYYTIDFSNPDVPRVQPATNMDNS